MNALSFVAYIEVTALSFLFYGLWFLEPKIENQKSKTKTESKTDNRTENLIKNQKTEWFWFWFSQKPNFSVLSQNRAKPNRAPPNF